MSNIVKGAFGKPPFDSTVEALEKILTEKAPGLLEELNIKETHEEGKQRILKELDKFLGRDPDLKDKKTEAHFKTKDRL